MTKYLITGFFFVCYFFVLYVKHNFQFQTFGMDLGFYDQIIYKASLFDFSKSTIAEVLDRNYFLAFFENDFHLTLLLVAGFYKAVASIYWIFIFQALFSALIGLVLYIAALAKTKSKFFSLALMLAVLVSVPFQHVIFDGFTPEVFGAFFMALCFLSLFTKRNFLVYFSALGMIISKVEFSPILAIIGLIIILFEKRFKLGMVIFILGIVSFIFLVYWLNPLISPNYQNYAHLSLGYGQIGQNPQEVILNIFTRPLMVADAVINPPVKLNYLFQQLVSFGFLSLGGFAAWPLMAFEFFTRMGNNVMIAKWPLHSYTISTTLAIGTIYFVSLFKGKRTILLISIYLFFVTIFGDLMFHGPLNSFFKSNFYEDPVWARNNREAIKLIPKWAAVSANNSLVPHLSQREKIYVFPNISDARYIVLDLQDRPNSFTPITLEKAYNIIGQLVTDNKFREFYRKDNTLILEKL